MTDALEMAANVLETAMLDEIRSLRAALAEREALMIDGLFNASVREEGLRAALAASNATIAELREALRPFAEFRTDGVDPSDGFVFEWTATSRDDLNVCHAVAGDFVRARRIYAATGAARLVCNTCADTHMMDCGSRKVMCTRCPVPCPNCRAAGNGPFCETTPCSCGCHEQPARIYAATGAGEKP